MVNAIVRRWTARKGWREIDPERGRFILKPDLPVTLDLASASIHIKLPSDGLINLSSEGPAQFYDFALLEQQSLFDWVRKYISKLNSRDIGNFGT